MSIQSDNSYSRNSGLNIVAFRVAIMAWVKMEIQVAATNVATATVTKNVAAVEVASQTSTS